MQFRGKEMSITVLDNSGMSCFSIIESPELFPGDRRFLAEDKVIKEKREEGSPSSCCSSSSSSSIGKNSDLSQKSSSDGGEESGDTEVQSSYKGSLDAMEALEQVLPFRRGISRFYNGKSNSFTSLADATSSSSVKDLAKPENAYARKRRNLLACSLLWDKNNRSFPHRKRLANSSRTTLALAVAMSSCSESNGTGDNSMNSTPNLVSTSPPLRPPLHHQLGQSHCNGNGSSSSRNFSAWRSFSLADLQQCASIAATTTCTSGSPSSGEARLQRLT